MLSKKILAKEEKEKNEDLQSLMGNLKRDLVNQNIKSSLS